MIRKISNLAVFSRWTFLVLIAFLPITTIGQVENMALIKSGSYVPLYGDENIKVEVQEFYLDKYPVTNTEFERFLKSHPEWQKDKALALYIDENYLRQFDENGNLRDGENPQGPVTNISWFVAKKYCESKGKRLPTLDEWEYVAMADQKVRDARKNTIYNQYILSWYETPKTYNKDVGSTFKNYWGVYDLHGLVWEWTLDFNSVLISGESRRDLEKNNNLFCGAAAVGASDLMNYAAFMRYAFRGSLKARYSGRNLGFRCAQDAPVN